MPATDLIVSFKQFSKQKYYYRQGNSDLLFVHKVSLADAITCIPIRLITLDGRVLNIPVDRMMSPGDVMEVADEGFKIDNCLSLKASAEQKHFAKENEGKRGNLYI
jgi:DnaJ-class molecular chaperone